jgi:hypothetical protein
LAYQEFIRLNPSIEKHLGGFAPKYGSYLPWVNRFDLRIAQDFKINVGNRVSRLQFTADIINAANLLNSNWGIAENLNGNFNGFPILRFVRRDADTGEAVVAMNRTGGTTGDFHTTPTRTPGNQEATWAIQLGLRYTF